MYKYTKAVVVLATLLLLFFPGDGKAQGPQDESRAAEALELTREVARSLSFFDREHPTTKMTLVESPLLRFSNPVVGEFYAHLFIWTSKGRPAAAASIQKWYAPNQALHLELQSLAERPITGEYKQEVFWHPEEAGATFTAISDSPVPARAAPARLREMRQLAREFRVRIKAVNRGGDVDEELRLLAQPIYRYQSEDLSIQDGAIFAFVRGTDPELLLLVEARKSADGLIWQYAFAPMNSFEFHAFHRDREVWQKPQLAPPWRNVMDEAKSYMLIVDFDKKFLTVR
jgi:hypothetical protein